MLVITIIIGFPFRPGKGYSFNDRFLAGGLLIAISVPRVDLA
jgi:hypothetical protein